MKWTPEEVETLLKSNPDLGRLNGAVPEEAAKPPVAHPSKYRAQRTEYGGASFHSKKEAAKAAELDLLIKAGELSFYLRQVPFVVGTDPLTIYRADFLTFQAVYFDEQELPHWNIEVIETKGYYAPGAKRKLKLFREKYPMLKLTVE